jgi:uncharacterized protein
MGALSIHLDSVKESPRCFHLVSETGWWEEAREVLPEPEVVLCTPFALNLSGYRLGARLLFRGEVSGAVELHCGRCTEPYAHEFREPLELLLEPALDRGDGSKPGIELDADDASLGRYAGDELDFEPVLRDILVLAWPMQPRCVEGCLGLCPVCGTNQNLAPCSCDASDRSRPLATLGRLLDQSKQNRG